MDIRNTKWLITGGSSGLGLALAKAVMAAGGRVSVVARREDKLAILSQSHGFIPIAGDVAKKDDIYKISAQAVAQLGGVDFLVNNASALGETPLKFLSDTDCESFQQVFETNVLGPFRLTKAIIPTMALHGGGVVVNISSDAAVQAYARWGAYGVSKAALDQLSHIWAEEMKKYHVYFLSVDPGDMNTPMHHAAAPDADKSALKMPEKAAADLLSLLSQLGLNQNVPWRRIAL